MALGTHMECAFKRCVVSDSHPLTWVCKVYKVHVVCPCVQITGELGPTLGPKIWNERTQYLYELIKEEELKRQQTDIGTLVCFSINNW